jgi:hypothetical protein
MSNWLDFCLEHQITFRRAGSDNIEISCPFCRSGGLHLGLSLKSSVFGCWRDPSHSGRHPAKLIAALLNVSQEEANILTRQYFKLSLKDLGKGKEGTATGVVRPSTFFDFTFKDRLENQFLNYLEGRGVDSRWAVQRYGMKYCVAGQYAHRIIVPLTINDKWVTWTARGIGDQNPKYKMPGIADGAKMQPSDMFFDADNLRGGRLLLITEGVFDSIKINSVMMPGIHATCLFGKNITDKQVSKLMELCNVYEHIGVALDADAQKQAVSMVNRLKWYVHNLCLVRPSAKDFGEMKVGEIRRSVEAWAA